MTLSGNKKPGTISRTHWNAPRNGSLIALRSLAMAVILGLGIAVAPGQTSGKPSKSGKTAKSEAKPDSAAPSLGALSPSSSLVASNPFESSIPFSADTPIDKAVLAKLNQLGIQPPNVCNDSVFVRRVFLDVIGTLPTAKEAREFIEDKNPNKRTILIDQLLDRDEFGDYWAMKWSDLLRVKAEFPINLWPKSAQAYHRWIRASIRENKPYDWFVREMLTASGSNAIVPEVNFYRAMQSREPQAMAQIVALTFMGERAEKWPKEKLAGMAGFFSQVGYKGTVEWKEEIVFFDPNKVAGGLVKTAVFPDGTPAKLARNQDPREVFANWLIHPKNPCFTRCIANRVWYWLLGRGIIHEPDDIRDDNPPSNPELLALLEQELIASKYDIKRLFRVILNSKTYQLSCIPKTRTPQAEACFAYYPLRRLQAEVLIDAINEITGSTEKYTSPIPEPFSFIPENLRSVALPDGSITSTFLELFGKPARDTGLESERINRITAAQQLHMLNSSHVQKKIEQSSKLMALGANKESPREALIALYLTVLSRFPTNEEMLIVSKYPQSSNLKGREVLVDLTWALMNSVEFLYRH